MVDDKDVAKARALSLLEQQDVKESLAEIFSFYTFDLYDILTIATVENAGVRPERLTNEVFSSFHHIVRGLCVEDADVTKELNSARRTHLKRAALDAYKISINAVLSEDNKARELLDYLVLVEDFSRFVPDGLNKVNEIKELSRGVKNSYRKARKHEALGKFNETLSLYNEALEGCYDLRTRLEIFTHDKSYILACAREAKKEKEVQKNRLFTALVAILAAITSSVLTYKVPDWIPNEDTTSIEVEKQTVKQVSSAPVENEKNKALQEN